MNKQIIKIVGLVFVLGLLGLPLAGNAIVAKNGDTVLVEEKIEGNVFLSGNIVTINGMVNGDVFAAGNSIIVNGIINGDLFAAASNIDITGAINGNLRVIGSNINIRGNVERNILAAAANTTITEGAAVGGHITYAGGVLNLNGTVDGQIDAASGQVVINNQINGDIKLKLGEEGRLVLLTEANINGNLAYTAANKASIQPGAQVQGEVVYNKWQPEVKANDKGFLGVLAIGFVINQLMSFISWFVLGLIIIAVAKRPIEKIYYHSTKDFWQSVGFGFLFLIVTPVLAIVLLITILGLPLGVIAFLIYGLTIYFARSLAGYVIGKKIAEWLKWKTKAWLELLIGLAVLTLLCLIPFIGWLVTFIVTIMAIGALIKTKKDLIHEWK